jgi:hypothetical protein
MLQKNRPFHKPKIKNEQLPCCRLLILLILAKLLSLPFWCESPKKKNVFCQPTISFLYAVFLLPVLYVRRKEGRKGSNSSSRDHLPSLQCQIETNSAGAIKPAYQLPARCVQERERERKREREREREASPVSFSVLLFPSLSFCRLGCWDNF